MSLTPEDKKIRDHIRSRAIKNAVTLKETKKALRKVAKHASMTKRKKLKRQIRSIDQQALLYKRAMEESRLLEKDDRLSVTDRLRGLKKDGSAIFEIMEIRKIIKAKILAAPSHAPLLPNPV